ncbi:MAG: hypothetical protein Q9211_001804 [Gyalolechia sp. 1 TL-2023]
MPLSANTLQDLFLREVDIGEELRVVPPFKNILEWNTEEAPELDPRHCYRAYKSKVYRRPLRMRTLPLEPGARGFIAAQDSHGILALYGSNARPEWTFFPLAAEEQILDVFVREWEREMIGMPPALMVRILSSTFHVNMLIGDKVRTTAGRSYTFGSYIPARKRRLLRFVPLKTRADGVVSGLYFNAIGPEHDAIYDLAITCRPHPDIQLASSLPMHPQFPESTEDTIFHGWYATSASLNDIAQIQLCKDTSVEEKCCIGLLIHYNNGSCESVGQWRWDFKTDEFLFAQESMSYLWFKMNENETRILDIGLKASSSTDTSNPDDMRQEKHLRGDIVWWFTGSRDRLAFVP